MTKEEFMDNLVIMDEDPVIVQNPFSGATETLTPEAVAIYDVIKGAEVTKNEPLMLMGLDIFRTKWPREYMTLLD